MLKIMWYIGLVNLVITLHIDHNDDDGNDMTWVILIINHESDMVTFSLLARTVNIKPAGKLESWTRTRGLGPRVRQVKSNHDEHIIIQCWNINEWRLRRMNRRTRNDDIGMEASEETLASDRYRIRSTKRGHVVPRQSWMSHLSDGEICGKYGSISPALARLTQAGREVCGKSDSTSPALAGLRE